MDGVATVRQFNRFYTRRIGVLNQGFLRSPFSLAEARVLYELKHRKEPTASEIADALALDSGYLSRILRKFERERLVRKQVSSRDSRKSLLALTRRGESAFAGINRESDREIGTMLQALSAAQRRRLLQSMREIERLLGGSSDSSFVLRPHQPGDMGWVVERHGAIYAEEYGWDEQFEALVAEIVARFIRNFDPKRERCWIAERDGQNAGSVFLVKRSKRVAQLRLLLVEPSARGHGIGMRLVEECIPFARRAGYQSIMLWTNDVLHAARAIYVKCGFRLVEEEKHHSFGHDLIGQTWEMKL